MTALRRSFGAALAVVAVLFGLSITGTGTGPRAAASFAKTGSGIAVAPRGAPAVVARVDSERVVAAGKRIRDRALGACAAIALVFAAAGLRRRLHLGPTSGALPFRRARAAVRGPPAASPALI